MSQVTKTILILVKQQGLDQVNTAVKGLTSTSQAATKSTNGLGQAFAKGQGDALKLRTGVVNLDKAEVKATKSVDNFGKAADNTGKKTGGLAAKFQGNKGLIFATVGIATAGLEAVGMFQQFANAQAKVSEATTRLNQLEAAGLQHTEAYRNAQNDLTDANRSAQFAFRILALSVGDLIPFSLLLINSFVKLKDTVSTAKPALDAASKATTGLGAAANTASTGGLTGLFNRLGQTVTNTKNYDAGIKTASTSTNTFTTGALRGLDTGFQTTNTRVLDATRLIGTGNNGLVGGVTGLSVEMDKSNKMSTKFQDAFKNIGASIKNLPNTFKNIGSSVASFFTHFGTNITKFGGALKTAGTAALTFGKTLAMAMLSNPITAIIAGISAAVLALATDFGGIRTAANNFGVALGNAIPPAKGILQAIGDAANGALDAVAGFLGLQKEVKNTGTAATAAATQFAPLKKAITDTVAISGTIGTLRLEIDKLHNGVDIFTKNSIIGLDQFRTAVDKGLTPLQKQTPAVQKVLQELDSTIVKVSADGYDLSKAKTELNAVLNKLQVALISTEGATLKQAGALLNSAKSSKELTAATNGLVKSDADLASQVAQLNAELKLEDRVTGELSKKKAEARKQVAGWLNDMGMATTATDKQKASLIQNAASLQMYGDKVVFAKDGNIDLAATIQNLVKENQMFEQAGTKAFGAYVAMVNKVGTSALPTIEVMLEDLKNKHPEIGEVAEKLWNDYIENTVQVGNQLMIVNEAEEEQAKAVESTADSVAKKAKELGIYNKIQSLSLQDQQNAIKITEDQTKAENTARLTLQQLASARGLDIKQIGLSNAELFNLIQTLKLEANTMDDVYAATGQLIDARQQEAKAADLETQAAELFLQTLDQTAPVIGMTGKGLLQLSKTYDETANASSIAADEVGNWVATLEKEQAIEKATLSTLQQYAKQHDIEIPAAIANDIEKTKEYIQIVQGIGPAAKKAADEALKAFESITGNTKSALEGIISDSLGEDGDEVKKAIKGIQKTGLALDSLTAQQHIIDIFLNDENFANDIQSLGETMINEFGRMENFAIEEATQIGDSFVGGMIAELDGKAPDVANSINAIWNNIKNNPLPGETGDQMIGRLAQALGNISPIMTSAQKAGAAVPTGIQQGAGNLGTALNPGLQGILQSVLGKGAQLNSAGKTIGTQATQGVGAGIQGGASTIQNATLAGINNPITNTIGQVPGAAGTALAPVEGIFSTAFLKASTVATGHMNLLFASVWDGLKNLVLNTQTELGKILTQWGTHVTSVTGHVKTMQGAFSTLSTSTKTYMSSMGTNIGNFATSAGTSFGKVANSSKTAHTALSTMSKSVATYMSSMSSHVSKFASAASSAFSKVGSQAQQATSKVKALQSAINSLKSKSINIHVGLTGPGARFMRHGGAFISADPTGFAQGGMSFINSKPRKIGGVNISEFGKPELVTVTPLSNPSDPTDKNMNLGMSIPRPQPIPSALGANPLGNRGGAGQPITVTGNLNITIKTQNGKVLAQEVQPYLFEGFSGVT